MLVHIFLTYIITLCPRKSTFQKGSTNSMFLKSVGHVMPPNVFSLSAPERSPGLLSSTQRTMHS